MTSMKNRYPNIDLIRGIAIFLMFVYHIFWNLSYFDLVHFELISNHVWTWFARFIAGIILFVGGVCVVISTLNKKKKNQYTTFTNPISKCRPHFFSYILDNSQSFYIFWNFTSYYSNKSIFAIFIKIANIHNNIANTNNYDNRHL